MAGLAPPCGPDPCQRNKPSTRLGTTTEGFHNADLVVVGGALASLHEDLLADTRGVVCRRASPLATPTLVLEAATLGAHAGITGARRIAVSPLSPAGLAPAVVA